MNKSKLISLLITLDKKELKDFDDFINSPFFNKNEIPVKLFGIIKKYHPEYDSQKVAMEVIFPKLFPTHTYEEQRLRYAMTDLTRLLESYLTYLEFEKKEHYKNYLLMSAFDKRGQDKYFRNVYDSDKAELEKENIKDVDFYFNRYLLEEKAYQHFLGKGQNISGSSIQQAVDNLDLFYLSNKLRYSCILLSRQNILHEDFSNKMLEQVQTYLDENNFDHIPAIAIYHLILKTLLSKDDESNYKKLVILIRKNLLTFSKDELQDMFSALLNFCIHQINSGNQNYLSELWEHYKFMIKNEIIFDHGFISPHEFKNIVVVGLRMNAVEWIEDFLNSYKENIQPEFRENTYTYNLAFLYNYKKEYGKALKLLQTAEFKDVYYHLDAKALLLRTYFELEETEPFFSLVDAFQVYLKRNKIISEYQRTIYQNLVKYAKKLMQIKSGNSHTTVEEISKELELTKQVANLQWLTQKIEELQKTKI